MHRQAERHGAAELVDPLVEPALREHVRRVGQVRDRESEADLLEALGEDEVERVPPVLDDVGQAERADVADAVVEEVHEQAARVAGAAHLDHGVEEVLRGAGEGSHQRRLHLPRGRVEGDLGVDVGVVGAQEQVLADRLAALDLEAGVGGRVGVGERGPELRRRLDDPLDGVVEILVEEAGRDDLLARAGEQLPAHVDVLDQRLPQVGVADGGPAADHVGELERRELPELGTVDGLADPDPEVLVVPDRVHEVDGGEDVGFVEVRADDVGGAEDRPREGIHGVDLLAEVLDPGPRHEAEPDGQRDVDHAVGGQGLLLRVVLVGRPRLLLELEVGADEARREQLFGRPREVEAARVRRDEPEPPRQEVAGAVDVAGPELDLGREARPVLHQGRPVRAELRAVVHEVVELAQPALRLVGEHERLARGVELVEHLAQVGLGPVCLRYGDLPVEPAVRGVREQVVAAHVVRADLLFDEEEPLVADVVVGVAVEPLEDAGLVGADVRVEVVDRQPVVRVELVGEVADAAQGRDERGLVEVVGAVEPLDAAGAHLVERALLVGDLRVLRVPDGGDHPQLAEPAAEQPAVGLVHRLVPPHRVPDVAERLAQPLEVAAQEPELVAREPAAADDLAVGEVGGQRAGAAVEPVPGAAPVVAEPALAGGDGVVGAAQRELVGGLGRQLQRDDLDEAARELRRLVGSVGLADLHAVDEAGREQVERHHPAVGLGGGQGRAVQGRVAVALAEAPHEDRLAVDDRHPGHPAHGVGRVRVVVRAHLRPADVVLHRRGAHPQHHLRRRGGALRLDGGGDDRHLFGEDVGRQRDLHLGDRPGDDLDVDELLGVPAERDPDPVPAGRQLEVVAAVEVRIGDVGGADRFDRHAGEGDRVGLVDDHPGHPPRVLRRGGGGAREQSRRRPNPEPCSHAVFSTHRVPPAAERGGGGKVVLAVRHACKGIGRL